MLLFALTVAVSLAVSFYCSLAEATLLSVGHTRVEGLASRGSRAGTLLRRFKLEPESPIAAILILNTVAHTGGATIATEQFLQAFPDGSPALFATAYVIAVLALTEILPKTIGVVHANTLAAPMAHAVRWTMFAVAPALVATRWLSRLFTRNRVQHTTSLEEIRVLTTMGANQGAFGNITADLIRNVTRLRETKAREVMVPRDRVAYLSGAKSTDANLDLVHRSGHSRFPFTPTGDLDQVSGFVLTKELLIAVRENSTPDWKDLLLPLLVVPESATLNHVLRRFQRAKRHLAIVVDEYGATRGIITLEDVLEEIVGEIEDELDTEEPHILERPDGSFLCRGSAETSKVFARLELADVDTDSSTVSGFMAERLGTVPTPGAAVDVGAYRFVVTKANNRRAERVRISRVHESATQPPP